jgi:hypothetical protein
MSKQTYFLPNNKIKTKCGEDDIADDENILNYKGIFYNEDSEQKYYEHGVHFKYKDLCKRLQLVIQLREKENLETNANKNHSRNKTNNMIPGSSLEDKKKVCTINFDMIANSKYLNLLPKENSLQTNNKPLFQTFDQEKQNPQNKDTFKFSPTLQNNALIQKSIINSSTNKVTFDVKANVNNYFTNK